MNILYQDEHLLLVEKPQGLLSQADSAGGDSLPRQLQERGFPVLPVHRLDRDTGGVMVYALTQKAAAGLSQLVGQHTVFFKEYLTVIHGCPDTSEGTLEDLLYHDARRNKSFVVKRMRNGVRRASLSYRVMQSVGEGQQIYTLLSVRLHTGRTHQIRVQFASRGMPVVGDRRYGSGRDCPLALWSHSLSFSHPITNQPVSGHCLPDTAQFPWNQFNGYE